MPKISELLHAHPLLGALPAQNRSPLESSIKETMKLRGVTLYKEGSKPSGIWLISVGVVKVGFLFKYANVEGFNIPPCVISIICN
jgi:hypothetical protein